MIIIFFILNLLIFGFGYFCGSKHAVNTCAEAMQEIRDKLSSEAKTELDKVIKGELENGK